MRKILFRAKGLQDGKWHTGDLHLLCDKPHIHIQQSQYPFAGMRRFIDPNTIGQYSGLADSDNKPMFEGDIVLMTAKDTSIVPQAKYGYILFADGGFNVCDADGFQFIFTAAQHYTFRVVGNRYDNEQLLYEQGILNKNEQ